MAAFSADANRNILYIVSDGIETCGGDPVKAAEGLKQSNVKPVVNIIGFDVDAEGQKQLRAVAEAAGGTYADVKNQDELRKQFEQSREEAAKWIEWFHSSRGQAIASRGDHSKQILDWRSGYTGKMGECYRGLSESIGYLARNNKISGEQRNKMLDLYSKLRSAEIEEYEKMSKELFTLQKLEFDEAYRRIDELFEANNR